MNSPLEVVKKDINIIIYDFSIANILEDSKLTLIGRPFILLNITTKE